MRMQDAVAALKGGAVVDVSRVIGRTPSGAGGPSSTNLRTSTDSNRQPQPENG